MVNEIIRCHHTSSRTLIIKDYGIIYREDALLTCDGAVLCQSGYCYNFSFQHHSLSKEQMDRGRGGGSKYTPLREEISLVTRALYRYVDARKKDENQTLSPIL